MKIDVKDRCSWPGNNELMIRYHDEEWGVPVHDDRKHFEFFVLDSFQAGLSWQIILNKRENFRSAFAGFDFKKVAKFSEEDYNRLLQDEGIVRNKAKIRATINNAQRFIETREEFGSFDTFIWSFVNDKPVVNQWERLSDIPAKTALSDKISKELKRRGFQFVGSTIIYAYLQGAGLINDHVTGCFRYRELGGHS